MECCKFQNENALNLVRINEPQAFPLEILTILRLILYRVMFQTNLFPLC